MVNLWKEAKLDLKTPQVDAMVEIPKLSRNKYTIGEVRFSG